LCVVELSLVMRTQRKYLLAPDHETCAATYHCVTRVVWREFLFKKEEKEFFRKAMRQYEAYCGVKVLAYCLMSNHVHIMVKVPPRAKRLMGDTRFLEHLRLIYSAEHVADVARWLGECWAINNRDDRNTAVRELKERYTRRMWDLSEFMKAVKQKFTQWYNKRNGLSGTLWEGRFKSVLVEDGYAARMTAAYIDLNPVRAGMVKDPKDYRWCSYGEACAGGEHAQQGLLEVMQKEEGYARNEIPPDSWNEVRAGYRMLIAEEGAAADQDQQGVQGESKSKRRKKRNGFSADEIEKVLESGGQLSAAQMLHCKARYFTDGVVLGSREFVDKFFSGMKEKRPEKYMKRTTGARKLRQVRAAKIYCLRDLRKKPLG
jgi:putative transposase